MPTHWTYDECPSDSDLMQGDILAPTGGLLSLFKEVHPHFSDQKYLAFVIITQSCDLDCSHQPNGKCSARYINVAAVRPLSIVLFSLLDTVCENLGDGFYSEKEKNRARDLLARIFNQNEQKLGLFYLYPDSDAGIAEDAVAFLRVSVAFRVDHYDRMRAARQGRLKPEFANKLGWLVGNLFSRIGTRDWETDVLKKMIHSYLLSAEYGPTWLDDRIVREFKQKRRAINNRQQELNLLKELAQQKPTNYREIGVKRVMEHIENAFTDADPKILNILRTELMNDPGLTDVFRR